MKKQRIYALLLGTLLCAFPLSACVNSESAADESSIADESSVLAAGGSEGSDSISDSENVSESSNSSANADTEHWSEYDSQVSKADSEKPADSSQADKKADGSRSEIKEAVSFPSELSAPLDVMKRFLKACQASNEDDILAYSNLKFYYNIMDEVNPDVKAEFHEMLEDIMILTDYTIQSGKRNVKLMEAYNEEMKSGDSAQSFKELKEKAPSHAADVEHLISPIKDMCHFTVAYEQNGKTHTETFFLEQYADTSEWCVDMVGITEMAFMESFVVRSRISRANSDAKSLFNAINTALIEMDEQDLNVVSLDGRHEYKSTDFKGKKIDSKNLEEQLLARTAQYDKEIDYSVGFTIENGVCIATAVLLDENYEDLIEEETYALYGTYPVVSDKDNSMRFDSIQDALKAAEKKRG